MIKKLYLFNPNILRLTANNILYSQISALHKVQISIFPYSLPNSDGDYCNKKSGSQIRNDAT